MTTWPIRVLADELFVHRLPRDAPVPAAIGGSWHAITRTDGELSIVCDQPTLDDAITSGPFRAIGVAQRLDHDLVGVLHQLVAPLSRAEIPVFAISTFDTDYVLVPADALDSAIDALEAEGVATLDPTLG